MPCYRPLVAYRSLSRGGKLVFSKPAPFSPEVKLPCGQCLGCRLEHSRMWALRCVHEASRYDQNCFITLTYRSEHYPRLGNLDKSALQNFFKRFRKSIYPRRIRYFACGEYGDEFDRPHFHACIFGFDFDDKTLWTVRNGVRLFVSDHLARCWPFGFSTIGEVNFQSAAYLARYVVKKVKGAEAEPLRSDGTPGYYTALDGETGELVQLTPEFVVMSRRPGIGKNWFEEFRSDCYPSDFLVHEGRKFRVPRYYDNQYLISSGEDALREIKRKRVRQAKKHSANNTPERLKVREKVARSRVQLLKRGLQDEA